MSVRRFIGTDNIPNPVVEFTAARDTPEFDNPPPRIPVFRKVRATTRIRMVKQRTGQP